MKYTTVFLDFDDTLIDTQGYAKTCLEGVYNDHNVNKYYSTFAEFHEIYHSLTLQIWEKYEKGEIDKSYILKYRFNLPFQQFENIQQDYIDAMNDDFLSRVVTISEYFDGAKELLDYLKSKYRLVMLSNGFSELQYDKIKSVGFDGYFDEIVLSDVVGANKPDPKIFQYALDKIGATAQETIMIGDNIFADIKGAMNSNIDQIWYNPNKQNTDLKPTHMVDNLHIIKQII